LRVDPDWHETVLLDVRPTLEDLAALHGVRLREGSPQREKDLRYLETASALASSGPRGGLDAWRAWCDTLGEQLQASSPMLRLPDDPVLEDAMVVLRRDMGLPKDTTELPRDLFTPLSKWFNGDWLEHYVLAQIIQIAGQVDVHDCGMSLATEQSKGRRADFDFEFDVAAMRGYQLFGLSCTTSTRKDLAKFKLFEAYVRARQLGGDEARVGLVCGYEHARRFEREVVQEWLAKDKIKVFGPHELPDLAGHLDKWFMTAQ